MKKLVGITVLTVVVALSSACGTEVEENTAQTTVQQEPAINYSENILISVNNGASGYGTLAECTDADIVVYKDKTVKIFMDTAEYPEIGSFILSDEDYEKLSKLADPEKIAALQVENDTEVCDGGSYYIKLYDENDETVVFKGGYMPNGGEFWEVYQGIKEVLKSYNPDDYVNAYRETM